MTRELVDMLGVKTERVAPISFDQLCGSFKCTELVQLEWSIGPQDILRVVQCYVLPDTNKLDCPLFGKDFINTSASLLLDDEPTRLVTYVAQRHTTVSSGKDMLGAEIRWLTNVGNWRMKSGSVPGRFEPRLSKIRIKVSHS